MPSKGAETIALIEGLRALVLGIDDHRVHGDGRAGAHHAADRVEQQYFIKAAALLHLTNCEPPEHSDRHRVVRQPFRQGAGDNSSFRPWARGGSRVKGKSS